MMFKKKIIIIIIIIVFLQDFALYECKGLIDLQNYSLSVMSFSFLLFLEDINNYYSIWNIPFCYHQSSAKWSNLGQ